MLYPNTKPVDLETLHASLKSFLAELFPNCAVSNYERFESVPAAGTVNFGLSAMTPADDIATEQFAVTLDWDVFFFADALDDAQGLVSAFARAGRLLAALTPGERFGEPVSAPRVEGAFPDFISFGGDNANGWNNAGAAVVVRVSFSHDALLGENVHELPAETPLFKEGIGVFSAAGGSFAERNRE